MTDPSRRPPHRTRAGIVVAASLACWSCGRRDGPEPARSDPSQKDGRNPDAERVVRTCLEAARTGFEVRTRESGRRAFFACAQIYLEPSCRHSLELTTDPLQRAGHVSDACRAAYCPILPDPSPGCFLDGKLDVVQSALLERQIRAFELGGERAQRLGAGLLALFHQEDERLQRELPRPPPACDNARDGGLALEVRKEGVWVGSTLGERSFVARCGGEIDGASVAAGLQALAHGTLAGRTDVEVAAPGGVRYQDLVTAMDSAIRAGFPDVLLQQPAERRVVFPRKPRPAELAARRCGENAPLRRDAERAPCLVPSASAATPPPSNIDPQDLFRQQAITLPRDILRDAPVVVVTRDEVTIAGRRVAGVEEMARGDASAYDALVRELRSSPARPPANVVILQADETTDMAVVNQVVRATNADGRTILFAVKNK